MTASFTPRVDALPPPQRRLWRELGGTPAGFVLYGGTALAVRLGHRQSVDFYFFSSAGDLAALPRDVRRRLLDAAAAVDLTRLPRFEALTGVAPEAS